jgi:hypothetical protein
MAWSITFVVTARGRIITDVNSMVERSTLAEYHRQRQRNADRKNDWDPNENPVGAKQKGGMEHEDEAGT